MGTKRGQSTAPLLVLEDIKIPGIVHHPKFGYT